MKEKIISTYNLQATIASGGYHVYKETTWSNANVTRKLRLKSKPTKNSIAIDPYVCEVKAKEKYFDG